MGDFQPSLSGLLPLGWVYPGLTSWATLGRPCGTGFVNPGSHAHSSVPATAHLHEMPETTLGRARVFFATTKTSMAPTLSGSEQLAGLRMPQSEHRTFGLGNYVVHRVVPLNWPKGRVGV